jgi:hypothetical protein
MTMAMPWDDGISRWKKLGLVLGGYALAFVTSGVCVFLYDRRWTAADNQTMGGMIAGGEMMLGFAVFCLAATVPTGLALWFLRGSRRFWSVFTTAGLIFAISGLCVVLMPLAVGAGAMGTVPAFVFMGLLAIVQMFGSPVWIAGFLLFAVLAPARDLRRRMLLAAAIEVVIAGCGALHFFLPRPPI